LLLIAPLRPADIELLRGRFDIISAPTAGEAAKVMESQGSRIEVAITIGQVGINRRQIEQMPNLKAILLKGAGHEGIDLDAARERNVAVATGSGTNAASVADHAMGLILSIARGIVWADKRVREGQWAKTRNARPLVSNKRLGIVGLGKIGSNIAKRASAGFDMEVSYTGRSEKAGVPYRYVPSVVELARNSDFLVLSCQGGAATRGLVNAEVLGALGPKGFLINVARASVIVADDLIAAIKHERIAGAALDLWEGEPSPVIPEELLIAPNVILSPHMGARSPETSDAAIKRIVDNLAALYSGGQMESRVV
jgi:lactate dehydrogenase-like 2-hydroxyacid dehydrogenase